MSSILRDNTNVLTKDTRQHSMLLLWQPLRPTNRRSCQWMVFSNSVHETPTCSQNVNTYILVASTIYTKFEEREIRHVIMLLNQNMDLSSNNHNQVDDYQGKEQDMIYYSIHFCYAGSECLLCVCDLSFAYPIVCNYSYVCE